MKRTTCTMWMLAGAVIAANTAWADDTSTPNTNPANPLAMPLTSQQFVTDAATANLKEVYVSQLALDKSGNSDVKNFAQHMIKDHSASNKKLEKIAQDGGYAMPSTNTFTSNDPNWNNSLLNRKDTDTPKGQLAQNLISTNLPNVADYQAIQQLQQASGAQFDQAYMDGMVRDHTAAINEFENASQTLSDPALKKFADKTLPTLRKHSDMAHQLDDKVGSQTAQSTSGNNTTPTTASNMPMN